MEHLTPRLFRLRQLEGEDERDGQTDWQEPGDLKAPSETSAGDSWFYLECKTNPYFVKFKFSFNVDDNALRIFYSCHVQECR